MQLGTLIAISLSLLCFYGLLFPTDVLVVLRSLKCQFRSYLINKYGTQAFNAVEQEFRRRATKRSVPQNLIELALQEQKSQIIQQRGSEYANELLGEPEWYE